MKRKQLGWSCRPGASSLERVELVKRQMEQIDENCFLARNIFWAPLIWEIEYGVL